MDILDKYKYLSVTINCLDSKGSGCIFQANTSEFTYILTAKHCLCGTQGNIQKYKESDIIIKNYINGKEIQLNALKVYEHSELDIAIIIVDYFELPFKTLIANPKLKSALGLYGFPSIFSNQPMSQASQRLICDFLDKKEEFIEFIPHKTESYTNEPASNIKGFSGSGLYLESKDDIFLTGIFTQLKDAHATFDTLKAIKIDKVNELLNKNKLPELLPKELVDFTEHIESAFEVLDGKGKPYLRRIAKKIANISPNEISNKINKRLFLPYNSNYELEVYESKIWEGWIALLTYMYINFDLNEGKFKIFQDQALKEYPLSKSKTRLFYTERATLQQCIMALCDVDTYDELNAGELIIINNKKTPPTKQLSTEKIKTNILKSIDGDLLFERKGQDITNPNYYKDIGCIHIDLFTDKFAQYDDLDSFSEVEKAISQCVKEVLENV